MNKDRMKQRMIEVCERNTIKKSELESTNFDIVFEEPYIPYLPENWNGFLVLAEVQNLPRKTKSVELLHYIEGLEKKESKYRILRLEDYPPEYGNKIGVGPWDDGSLKLAFASVFPDKSIEQVAISNAILWSVIDKNGKNPTMTSDKFNKVREKIELRSCEVWKELLKIMSAEFIITAGRRAEKLIAAAIEDANWKERHHIIWAHPTPNYIGRISYLFPDVDDLLERFDSVNEAFPKVDLQKDTTTEFRNKVFYACHCINTSKRFSKK